MIRLLLSLGSSNDGATRAGRRVPEVALRPYSIAQVMDDFVYPSRTEVEHHG